MTSFHKVDAWCPMLSNGVRLSTQQNQLWYSPCCYVTSVPVENSTDIYQRRRQLIFQAKKDANAVCGECIRKEKAQKTSLRQFTQLRMAQVPASALILEIGSDIRCNAACIMCGPHLSTLWQKQHHMPVTFNQATAAEHLSQVSQLVDLARVQYITFVGGEPLLTSTHVELLNQIPDLSKVHVNYNTNGSILPSDEVLDLWNQCKRVSIMFSIDSIDKQFEFIRYPLSWKEVNATIIQTVEYLLQKRFLGIVGVHVTANALSAFYVDTIEQHFRMLSLKNAYPLQINYDLAIDKFDLKATPPAVRKKIVAKHTVQHQISRFLDQSEFDHALYGQMIHDLNWIHTHRNLDWREFFPDIAEDLVI